MRRRLMIFLTVLLVIVVAIQLVPVDRGTAAPVTIDVPDDVQAVLATSCYDCHSGATRWPWYGRVAPVSWIVAHHVEEGREHLDFSAWQTAGIGRQAHWREEIAEVVADGAMPPGYYLAAHRGAELDESERELLLRWARGGAGGH